MKYVISIMFCLICMTVFAYQTSKPETHDNMWMKQHGAESKADPASCLDCHENRTSCIKCHNDTAPRDHNASFKRKTHGLKAQWDRDKCLACHTEASCFACHQNSAPISHRGDWGGTTSTNDKNLHCRSGCHYPVQETTCGTCHMTSHGPRELFGN
ncbi:hypothetical protein [Seleniivibrio woodruffii]|uniref:hypothetical protein n=1 Tax=Seleniivibrio woodruffii TaxID=1078050 RepID=UPI0026F03944|nr:hypothetical protein [Seleniivibrio woodruffii]